METFGRDYNTLDGGHQTLCGQLRCGRDDLWSNGFDGKRLADRGAGCKSKTSAKEQGINRNQIIAEIDGKGCCEEVE